MRSQAWIVIAPPQVRTVLLLQEGAAPDAGWSSNVTVATRTPFVLVHVGEPALGQTVKVTLRVAALPGLTLPVQETISSFVALEPGAEDGMLTPGGRHGSAVVTEYVCDV